MLRKRLDHLTHLFPTFQLLEYVDDYVESELLSRRLAYFCARRLSMFCDQVCTSPRVQSPMLPSSTCASQTRPATPMLNPVATLFAEYAECALHRAIVLGLSCCIQSIGVRKTMNELVRFR